MMGWVRRDVTACLSVWLLGCLGRRKGGETKGKERGVYEATFSNTFGRGTMIYYTLREFATLPAIFVGGAPRPIDDEEIGTSEWMDGQRKGKGNGVFFFQGIHALLCGMDGAGRPKQHHHHHRHHHNELVDMDWRGVLILILLRTGSFFFFL